MWGGCDPRTIIIVSRNQFYTSLLSKPFLLSWWGMELCSKGSHQTSHAFFRILLEVTPFITQKLFNLNVNYVVTSRKTYTSCIRHCVTKEVTYLENVSVIFCYSTNKQHKHFTHDTYLLFSIPQYLILVN